jgi:hypothetical protein
MRKIVFGSILLVVSLVFIFSAFMSISSAQVDLRGKKGVVDPRDLKKDNPPERSLHIKEPPPPARPDPPKEVHQEKQHRHGSDGPPPGAGAPVPSTRPLPYVPPQRPVGR